MNANPASFFFFCHVLSYMVKGKKSSETANDFSGGRRPARDLEWFRYRAFSMRNDVFRQFFMSEQAKFGEIGGQFCEKQGKNKTKQNKTVENFSVLSKASPKKKNAFFSQTTWQEEIRLSANRRLPG